MSTPAEQHLGDALAIQVARLDERTLAVQRDIGELRTELREFRGEMRTLYRFVVGNTLLLVLAIAGAVVRVWHG